MAQLDRPPQAQARKVKVATARTEERTIGIEIKDREIASFLLQGQERSRKRAEEELSRAIGIEVPSHGGNQ